MSRVVHDIALNMPSILRRLRASTTHGTQLPFTGHNSKLNCCCKILSRNYASTGKVLTTYERRRTVDTEHFDLIPIYNEPVLQYEAESTEREQLEKTLQRMLNNIERVPIVINGQEINVAEVKKQVLPYDTSKIIAVYGHAHRQVIEQAIEKAVHAQKSWDKTKLSERIDIWTDAADLISTKYRYKILAATMLGQGKTVRQAELDVAELVDFMRVNSIFLRDIANYEPINDRPSVYRNTLRLRGLTGFIAAISPFNYTSLAGNLAYTPALMGNSVIWKPSDSAILSNWYVFQALREAGLPDGVVNFVPAPPALFASIITGSSNLAGINFTGSANVLKILWQLIAENINVYKNYPRLIGETGGKNFHFVHSTANTEAVIASTIRSAFEYAGQKCSSCSMLYVPESLWESEIKFPLVKATSKLFVSDATYCDCFYSALINKQAYDRALMNMNYIKNNEKCTVLHGGTCSKNRGYYMEPTIIQIFDMDDRLCKEELLGPILCVYVYKDEDVEEMMGKVAEVNHGLTGSVFSSDSKFIRKACEAFKLNVGNLYINEKSTGSMVGQQPFGAGHLTGTNEKIGSPHYLLRWTSPQAIKESFVPHTNIYYPYMEISEYIKNINKSNSESEFNEEF